MSFYSAVVIVAALVALPVNFAHAADPCEDQIANASRKLGPDWIAPTATLGMHYFSPAHERFHGALRIQCVEGMAEVTMQFEVEGTDVSPIHATVAAMAGNLLVGEVTEKQVRSCILKVKKNDDDEVWLGVGQFGRTFECGKDDHSHYFRVVVPSS